MNAYCDMCKKELPIKEKQTPYGAVRYVKSAKTKVLDTTSLFTHLCDECALIIDNELLSLKLEILQGGKDAGSI